MIDERKLIEEIDKYHDDLKPKYISRLVEAEILDIIDIITEQPKVGEWISVKDRLPDEFEFVLIQNIHGVMIIASRIKNSWYNFQGTELCTAIAWMPLPEPFKE